MDVRPAGRGIWAVSLQVDAQKRKADAAGNERPVPMNDPVAVALFDAGGRTLYRRPHRIRSGAQTITLRIALPGAPARGRLDPEHRLLDREPDDNLADVAER